MVGAGGRGRGGERKAIVRRRLTPLLLVAALLLLLGSGVAARAQVVDAEDAFVARIAQERAAAGLPGLAVASDLQEVARRHAQRMLERGTKFHNPNLGSEVGGWALLAENVGFGPTVEALHEAFMASSSHRANILNTDVTQVGIGVVRGGDGRLYVVQVFRLPADSAPPPPPTTAPPPATTTPSPPITPPPATTAPPPTAPPPTSAPQPPAPSAPAPTVPEPLPAPGSDEVAAQAAPEVDLLSASVATPAAAVPDLDELATNVPAAAWVGAFLLAAVVGLQGQALRRLGLVR